MPRLPRYILPGYPQHVIQRGNNRTLIFLSDRDFAYFRKLLRLAGARYRCQVHAYVFMTNHVHMIMTPELDHSISKTMQAVGRSYVQYFNAKYRRTGTLWEGRYKATLIDTDTYLLTCYRYIELNPVRANMVAQPADYRWSSYHANARGEGDALVTPHVAYLALGKNAAERVAAYRGLFQIPIKPGDIDEIRVSTRTGWALGSDRFKLEMERLAQRRTMPLKKPKRVRLV